MSGSGLDLPDYSQIVLVSSSGSATHFPLQQSEPRLHEKPLSEQQFLSPDVWRLQLPGSPFEKQLSASDDDGQE
ncbi:hypothetical protein AKJ09_00630 [Labilithrix luteola]|uniref:Uncharacterized protein n=1 Tax=Labilithrix luteola TaxID=1391654 RepID=A0A0K1PKP5_9BACT|nr:hypothetical protein AKJ09_00630 [Labilithrix luteola]